MKKFIIILSVLLFCVPVLQKTKAQELNAQVIVQTPKLQIADPKMFKTLETDIREFLNSRKWTNDNFATQERIECSIIINITEEVSQNRFKAQTTIQSNRPIFNSNYKSLLLNYQDKNWEFEYAEFQPLEYNESIYLSELTSLLAYYAFVIIGLDYDTFSPQGGSGYYAKAQDIVNMAQNNPKAISKGWKAYDGTQNRYWLTENLSNARYETFRTALYKYHRTGLDLMYDKPSIASDNTLNALKTFEKLHADYPSLMIFDILLNAKTEEIVGIFSGSNIPMSNKSNAYNTMAQLDPSHTQKYDKINKSISVNFNKNMDINNANEMYGTRKPK